MSVSGRLKIAREKMYDILIKNGQIVDGTGESSFEGDVAISGDRIAEVGGRVSARARRVIDAKGCVVSIPGVMGLSHMF